MSVDWSQFDPLHREMSTEDIVRALNDIIEALQIPVFEGALKSPHVLVSLDVLNGLEFSRRNAIHRAEEIEAAHTKVRDYARVNCGGKTLNPEIVLAMLDGKYPLRFADEVDS